MRVTRLLLGAAAALALAGCGAGTETKAVPPAATGSLESLAAEVKCKPDMQTDADTIRQAICTNTDGKFILATFSTDRGQREWINDAKDYGGYYLVGRKWVAVGGDGTVKALRGTLGGDVEIGTNHSAHSGHGG
ncbi:hypothetical protein A6P39_029520 [Streptomyces sp. FXJ1.172]|jgi:hypothetical protein|uniref:hypothetical protein n=1 Tax=Streptomyces sp. FXJ1.172 TaxID=710705 RepID=UPI0018FE54A2|nr:hypothetical protein [Streptomyces sp. FXJ1.172]WEO97825.1 hypothetical protein A6P39_029520 [Streptomyces sp. FXJ1.172]